MTPRQSRRRRTLSRSVTGHQQMTIYIYIYIKCIAAQLWRHSACGVAFQQDDRPGRASEFDYTQCSCFVFVCSLCCLRIIRSVILYIYIFLASLLMLLLRYTRSTCAGCLFSWALPRIHPKIRSQSIYPFCLFFLLMLIIHTNRAA